MGIKCSLFGHAFDASNVERDREEQGSEVVITIREIETCTRCGQRRVVSENKEVTTLETPEDVELDDEPAAEPDDKSSTAPAIDEAEAEVEETETGTEVSTEPDATAAETEETTDDLDETETDDALEEEPPVTDDAEILDDEDEGPDREPGQWPQEAEEADEPAESEFTQFGHDDGGVDEEQNDAEFIDEDGGDEDESAPEFQTNEWPSEEEIDAASEPESAGPGAITVPDGSFVCEGCGFSTPVESSSLREGDFCPECHKETLVQVRE